MVLRVLLVAIVPGHWSLDANSILGLSTLGWIPSWLWVVQVIIVSFGMEMIRKYEAFAGPVILVTMALAVWRSPRPVAPSPCPSPTAQRRRDVAQIFVGGALWIAIYGTFVLNFCDFTRNAKTSGDHPGQLLRIPLNMLFFGAIVVVLAGAQYKINGTDHREPGRHRPDDSRTHCCWCGLPGSPRS